MLWLIEATLLIIAALLAVLVLCKCNDCLSKLKGDE